YLRKLLRQPEGADDLLQEVWFDVFRGFARLRETTAFRAWLYRIARDRVYRELRKRRLAVPPLDEGEVAAAGTEEDEEFTAEDAARIHVLLDDLRAEHREVLVLRFLEEMSYDEMARVVDCPVGTVRSRLHYAKEALRLALERSNIHDRERTGQGTA